MPATTKLVLLETSDLHGAVMPLRYADNAKAELGLAKIASLIRQERSKGLPLLLVDNGDLIQGTPFAYYHARMGQMSPNPMVECLNALSYDAAVIGNHEFNYGLPFLQKAIRESSFPWLSANLVRKGTQEPFFGQPYLVKELAGVKVGVLGLTTWYIPNWENPAHIRELDFLDAVDTARRWVRILREEQDVDVVVLSYHGGLERDPETGELTEVETGENQGYRLCMEVEGVDVLLTGHQHRELVAEINGVTVIQPGSAGKLLGKVTLELSRSDSGRWTVTSKRGEWIAAESAEADPGIAELAAACEAETQRWLDTPIGRTTGDMRITDPMQARLSDHPMIEFINRVQMEASGAPISNTALFDNSAKGFGEYVTMRDIVSNYIYPNTLKVIRVSGQDIRDALEVNASYFHVENGEVGVSPAFSNPKPQHYNYDMWEGIEYEFDLSRPVGQRVVKLTQDGKPLHPDASYDVVMNNYRAGGGGNYPMFKGKPVVKDIPTDVSELMANYILERGTVEASLNRNWRTVLPAETR
ncbi:bifunctional metallophosphatase/5'-nucleotidase [Gorillibacterium sp. sgz5001074]|uniref:bifunctional metallophosphatase/5'-nucleotidase n=1 Tax=Gorillibacterium sp. sgz5001074 TaxID=3446695 RepID=UPI003F680708